MTDFSRIDPNFKVEPCFSQEGLAFYDVTKPPFSLHGLLWEEGCFRRLPRQVAESVSEEVAHLSLHTAGGRVRFVTDSKRIAIRTSMHAIEKMPHFALTGSGGFDLFEGADYLATFIPPFGFLEGFSSQKVLESRNLRQLHHPGRLRLQAGLRFPRHGGANAGSGPHQPGLFGQLQGGRRNGRVSCRPAHERLCLRL